MSFINSISPSQSSLSTEATSRSVAAPAHQDLSGYAAANVQAALSAVLDETSLSGTGVLLAKALAQPDVRFARVAQLQQALAGGTYRVSSSDLAEKLIGLLQR